MSHTIATGLGGALLAFSAMWPVPAAPAQPGGRALAAGVEIHYSVVRTEAIRAYPEGSAERLMHGGVPRGNGQQHLMIALYDVKTKQRIDDAIVTARVAEPAQAGQAKKLESMVMAGAVTYGNYFRMTGRGPYRVTVNIRRPGIERAAETSFDYTAWGK